MDLLIFIIANVLSDPIATSIVFYAVIHAIFNK